MRRDPIWVVKFLIICVGGAVSQSADARIPATSQESKLTASDGSSGDHFGVAVAIDGDTAIVGSYQDDSAAAAEVGSAYVYVRNAGVWVQQGKLSPGNGKALDEFGNAVALFGDTALVAAHKHTPPGITRAGVVYVFVRQGTTWSQQAELVASDIGAYSEFGSSVSLHHNTALIGAASGDAGSVINAGAAYVFVRAGTTWSQQAKLTAADAMQADGFGVAVSIDGDTSTVGAWFSHLNGSPPGAGAAYVFARNGATWTQQAKLTAGDPGSQDHFGSAVSVAGNSILVGAPQKLVGAASVAGAAYVFVRSGSSWIQQAKLLGSNPTLGGRFGGSVSLSGNLAVIGARGEFSPFPGGASGAAYVFIRSVTNWSQYSRFYASDAASGDNFGLSVATSDGSAVVGVPDDNNAPGNDAGSAFVFTIGAPWEYSGDGVSGFHGIPSLDGYGPLTSGSSNGVAVVSARPNSTSVLFVAASNGSIPFYGGVLVPFPIQQAIIVTTDVSGGFVLPFVMPPGVPGGASIFLQCAVQDDASSSGVALSNALKVTTQ